MKGHCPSQVPISSRRDRGELPDGPLSHPVIRLEPWPCVSSPSPADNDSGLCVLPVGALCRAEPCLILASAPDAGFTFGCYLEACPGRWGSQCGSPAGRLWAGRDWKGTVLAQPATCLAAKSGPHVPGGACGAGERETQSGCGIGETPEKEGFEGFGCVCVWGGVWGQ